MKEVRILCFGILRERLGQKWLTIQISEGTTVATLRTKLKKMYPNEKNLLQSCMFSKNQHYVTTDEPITREDELALIPPVSGG